MLQSMSVSDGHVAILLNQLIFISQAHRFISAFIPFGWGSQTNIRCEAESEESLHSSVCKSSHCVFPITKSFRVSLFYLVGLFDLWSGIRTLSISAIGAYAISNYVKGPFMPWIGFIFLMGHMSINQLHRQWFNADGRVDITGKV